MSQLIKENINFAEVKWSSQLSENQRQALSFLSRVYGFKVHPLPAKQLYQLPAGGSVPR
jgi:hypothetical protein